MKSSDIDWKSGRVVYWDMESIDLEIPILQQLSELKEDLAQISYPSGLLVDVGWYPEFADDGAFLVSVTKNENWEVPLFKENSSSASALLDSIRRSIRVAEQHGAEA